MTDMLTEDIYRIANQHDIAFPEPVTKAQALLAAAEDLRAGVAEETSPDPSTLTLRTLKKMHAALVGWENREQRLTAAHSLVHAAQQGLDAAKFNHAYDLEAPLADAFNTAAAKFTAALDFLDGDTSQLSALSSPEKAAAWHELQDSGRDLESLAQARDAFSPKGNRAVVFSDKAERLTRTAVLPDRDILTKSLREVGVDGWAALIAHGATLRWQTKPEQVANVDAIMAALVDA